MFYHMSFYVCRETECVCVCVNHIHVFCFQLKYQLSEEGGKINRETSLCHLG